MALAQTRLDDIVIRRRFHAGDATHPVTQVYAVTFPGHTDAGTECDRYEGAEQAALELAEARAVSVWYEENSPNGHLTLLKSFRHP